MLNCGHISAFSSTSVIMGKIWTTKKMTFITEVGSTVTSDEISLDGPNISSFIDDLTKIFLDRNVNINYNSCQ